MKKIYLFISVFFILLYSNSYAVMKFDLGLAASWGILNGFTDPSPNPEVNSWKLHATEFSAGLSLDVINVMSWSKPYYGMGFGFFVGVTIYDQWLGHLKMSNSQTDHFHSGDPAGGTNKNLVQMINTMALDIIPMYRFYPTRELSIGVGPAISMMLNKGPAEFQKNTVGSNLIFVDSVYLSPMFADFALSLIIDTTITKFWGNFGLYFGINLRVPFAPLSIGVEGKGGIKYRFNT